MAINKCGVVLSLGACLIVGACSGDPIEIKERTLTSTVGGDSIHIELPKTEESVLSMSTWGEVEGYKLPLVADETGGALNSTYWASASNQGYKLLKLFTGEQSDPVSPYVEQDGKVVALIQNLKGMSLFGRAVVTGSLFSGKVDKSKLGIDPQKQLQSTLFGQLYSSCPYSLDLTYKYEPGADLVNGAGEKVGNGQRDEGSISAVWYDISQDDSYLTGMDLQTNTRILGIVTGKLSDTGGAWRTLHLDYELSAASLNAFFVEHRSTRLAIVLSASERGAEGIGAVGSKLFVEKIVLTNQMNPISR